MKLPQPASDFADKLVHGPRAKLYLAAGCLAVLGIGRLVSPGAAPRSVAPPPPERIAPILEQTLERREPGRIFRGVQDAGRQALRFGVAFPSLAPPSPSATYADYEGLGPHDPLPRGFGVVVSREGEVLTHALALAGRLDPIGQLPDGRFARGRVVCFDPDTDLALVRFDGERLEPPPLAALRAQPGELAVAAARYDGRELVAPIFVASEGADRYTISAASGIVVPGTPFFNLDGEALGIAAGSPDLTLAYPIPTAVARLRELQLAGRALPGTLGLHLQALSPELAAHLEVELGALVSDVRRAGPAARAGVEPGDLIVRFGGNSIGSVEEALRLIASQPLEAVTLGVRRRRNGKVEERELSVEPEPAFGTLAPAAGRLVPPADAPLVHELFSAEEIAAAGVSADAHVLAVEGRRVARGARLPAALARRPRPWLLYLQYAGTRYFALIGSAAAS